MNSLANLPVYNASAGLRDVGGSVNAYINVLDKWSVNPYASYTYIFDEFAASPIIDQFGSRNQFKVGIHFMREFRFGRER